MNTKLSPVRWIYSVIHKDAWRIVLLTLIHMAQGAAGVTFAFALRNVVDAAVEGAKTGSHRLFWWQFAALCGLVIVMVLLRAFSRHVDEKTRARLEKRFRSRIFSQLLRRSYAGVTAVHSGEWINRLTSDTGVVVSATAQILPGASGMIVRLVGTLVLLLTLIPQAVFVLIPAGVVQILFSLAFRKRLKKFHHATQQADGHVRSFIQERLTNLVVVRTFTQETATEALAEQHMDELVKIRMRRIWFVNLCSTAMLFAMQAAYVFGIGVCSYGILQGAMTYGTMSAILHLISQAETPFTQISGYLPQFYAMTASAERLMEVEQLPLDNPCTPIEDAEIQRYYATDFAALGMQDAHFTYESDATGEPVLVNRSFTIRKGEFAAFTGESGCGKSTTLKLLLSLYPLDDGAQYLESVDGTQQPLTAAWRGLFAYVPQGNGLVSGTIREVIAFGDTALMHEQEAIQKALEIACADSFVKDLPLGLDTPLGEQGSGLSEGQMQRLSIARALLSNRPILMLDEATSALDSTTEQQLLQNLRTMTDRTVLLITHRPAALEICDKQISC